MMNLVSSRDEIAKELGLEELPPEEREKILGKMSEALLRRVFLETVENLSNEEDKNTLSTILEGNPKIEDVKNFVVEKIPNYDNLVAGIVQNFKDEFKEDMRLAKEN